MALSSQANAFAALSALVDKLALELVFAQPDSDAGLLPVNAFLSEIEELAEERAVTDAIAKARGVVDEVLTTGVFSREALETLNAWVPWMQAVIGAVAAGKTPPGFSDAQTVGPSIASEPIHLDLENDRDVLSEFVSESREHLQSIESGALALEENPADGATLNSIFRAFHTFKGGAGFLNLAPISKLAHELENLLDLARQRRLEITSSVIEVILNSGDTLKQFVEAIELQLVGEAPQGPIVIPTAQILERVSSVIAKPSGKPVLQDGPEKVARKSANATVKVDTHKLDMLIDMVGEMVIAHSLVAQDADVKALASSRLARSLAQLARTTKDLQHTALALRMVPVGATFRKMNRMVRDLSMRSGKQIELVFRGEETELDRNIVEEIHDPLLHMIRNAVDHGIEKPEARAASGKSAVGRVTLAAFHQGGNVVIQIQDDGAGLNREKILKKASALGLVAEGAEPDENEIFNFIFAPGFSTAEAITDISGRGVGMDVVRRNIEQLRGKIEIQSTPGEGATFSIFLPLTLAIIDGLIVRVGAERYILPTLSIRESLRPTANMLSTVHGKSEIVDVRGRLLPLLRLNDLLGVACDQSDPTQAVVVIVESDGAQRCVLVDELIGKQEVVIKSLGDTFRDNLLLAGAAILGDGRVGLILDVAALAHPKSIPLSKAA